MPHLILRQIETTTRQTINVCQVVLRL